MKLRSIEAFCAAVEAKSISGAARRMYLSQPSVSERLAELERETGVLLLERSRSGVRLTAEGAIFHEQARKTLDELAGLKAIVHNLQENAAMQLRFSCCVTVGEHLLPEWLWEFKKHLPQTTPTVLMGNDRMVINAVKSGEMPLGIVASDDGCESLETTIILEDELIVVVAPQHHWAQRTVVAEDLADEPFISREQDSTIRAITEQTLARESGVSLNIQMELGSTTAIKEAIECGLGFAILSQADVQRKLEAGTLVQVKGVSIPWTFKLVRNPSVPLSRAEKDFYQFILTECKQVKRLGSVSPGFDGANNAARENQAPVVPRARHLARTTTS